MKTISKTSAGILAVLCLLGTTAVQADVRIKTHDNGLIDIKGTGIVITAADGSKAEVGPAGSLKIRGKDVPVTNAQQQLLAHYSGNLRDLEKRGEAANRQAWQMAGGILVAALRDLFTGANDAEKAGQPLKDEVLKLCDDVEAERKVQDQISDALPAFKPYAVIHENDTERHCRSDNESHA